MALSRVLQTNSKPHFYLRILPEFQNPTRRVFSSSCPGETKKKLESGKAILTKEQRTAAVESFVKKYMETHQGIFPKTTHVRDNVGGSYYLVRDILTNIKGNMLGGSELANGTSHDTSGHSESGGVVRFSSNSDNLEKNITDATSHTSKQQSCQDSNNSEAVGATHDMHISQDSVEVAESKCTHLPESEMVRQSDEKCISTNAMSEIQSAVHSLELDRTSNGSMKPYGDILSADNEMKTESRASRISQLSLDGSAYKENFSYQFETELTGQKEDKVSPGVSASSNETVGEVVKGSDVQGMLNILKSMTIGKLVSRKTDNFKGAIRGMQPEDTTQSSKSTAKKLSENISDSNSFEKSDRTTYKDAVGGIQQNTDPQSSKGVAKRYSLHDYKMVLNSIEDSGGNPGGVTSKSFYEESMNCSNEKGNPDSSGFASLKSKSLPIIKDETNQSHNEIIKMIGDKQIALNDTGMLEKKKSTVEAACSTEDVTHAHPIPNLIGDPDVPTSVVKNIIQTVKIKHLTPDISSRDIKEALGSYGCNISGFYFGSSSSVAYVEFETEEAKEKALQKHEIEVSGKKLPILRIDAPRTTVVRISNIGNRKYKTIYSIFSSFGHVKFVTRRNKEITDVHYELSEWPNMLNIVNRLNGWSLDGDRLVAQPATSIPPEILVSLWNHPDERKLLKSKIRSLLQRIDRYSLACNVNLTAMVNKYHSMDVL